MACNQQPHYPSSTYRPDCYDGAGETTFAVTFPYINKSQHDGSNSPYIRVFLFNRTLGTVAELSSASWSMPTSASVQLGTALTATQEVWIVRDSSVNGRLVDYAGGSTVSDSTLNLDSLQAWYLWEEMNANAELLDDVASDKNYFGAEFEFTGDGSTTDFILDDGTTAIEVELSKISLWVFVNGVLRQSDDYTTDLDSAGVAVVTLNDAPATGDDVLIRVAQQYSLAVNLEDDSIGTDKLQDCAVTIEKLCLDGDGTDKQVAGWTGGGGTFGANTLTHEWVSDFDAGVQANRLDQMAAPTADVDLGSNKIINVTDPTNAQDAATKAYVDAQITDATTSLSAAGTLTFAANGSQEVDLGFAPKWIRVQFKYYTFDAENLDGFAADLPTTLVVSPKTMSISLSGNVLTFEQTGSGSGTDGIVNYAVIG